MAKEKVRTEKDRTEKVRTEKVRTEKDRTEKVRLDVLMVERGLASSREKARALIMAGLVYAREDRLEKPSQAVPPDFEVRLKENLPYVSRGGLKMAQALEVFALEVRDKVAADIGASTGGFTDCLLQNGAARVYAIDVGYGQLDWKLRTDPRVVCLERTNARYLTADSLPEPIDLVVCDVAFISLTKIFPSIFQILKENGQAIVLIKPQFEAGPEKVGKKGVVRDPAVHREVVDHVLCFAQSQGFIVCGLEVSPIRGPEGNKEFLAWLKKFENPPELAFAQEGGGNPSRPDFPYGWEQKLAQVTIDL